MPSPVSRASLWSRRRFLIASAAAGAGVISGGALAAEWASQPGARGPAGSASPLLLAVASTSPNAASPSGSASASASPAATPVGTDRVHFRSRPDLTPPILHVAVAAAGTSPGAIFFTPANGAGTDGPMIMDESGDLIWLRPDTGPLAANFGVAEYRGERVLIWWEGTVNGGNGDGQFVIADASYTEMHRVRALNGYAADLHEFQITPTDSALFLAGHQVAGPAGSRRPLLDDIVQEIDLKTGRLVFEWHAADHVDQAESYIAVPTAADAVYDYIHANSVALDTDGNLLVSARNTSTIYKVNRQTGDVIWRLGGRRSDFAMAPDAIFAYQHDARRQPDGTITLFDDQSPPTTGQARAIALRLDEVGMTATLERAYAHPGGLVVGSQGNMQRLPNGNTFVGWGAQPWFTEFGADGSVAFDASFPAATQSYRSFRFPWIGTPTGRPAVAAETGSNGNPVVYASWNGATEVASWDVLAGNNAATLVVAGSAPRHGFETAITLDRPATVVAVQARDASGRAMAASATVDLTL